LYQLRLEDCEDGWVAGQHIRVRAFISGRVFESHPLTIANAPPTTSCSPSQTITLGAKASGDWTRALNRFAREQKEKRVPRIIVMLDGPYGGPSVDCAEYETVLFIAGGSGVTFTLALLDDLVGRIARLGRRGGERTKRIEFVWCIRGFGESIALG
jgi:predicted ferric reductase